MYNRNMFYIFLVFIGIISCGRSPEDARKELGQMNKNHDEIKTEQFNNLQSFELSFYNDLTKINKLSDLKNLNKYFSNTQKIRGTLLYMLDSFLSIDEESRESFYKLVENKYGNHLGYMNIVDDKVMNTNIEKLNQFFGTSKFESWDNPQLSEKLISKPNIIMVYKDIIFKVKINLDIYKENGFWKFR